MPKTDLHKNKIDFKLQKRKKSNKCQPIGLSKNLIEILESFFEPLPKEIMNSFNQPTE